MWELSQIIIKQKTIRFYKKILLYSYLATAVLFLKSVMSILSSNISSDSAVKKCNLKYLYSQLIKSNIYDVFKLDQFR